MWKRSVRHGRDKYYHREWLPGKVISSTPKNRMSVFCHLVWPMRQDMAWVWPTPESSMLKDSCLHLIHLRCTAMVSMLLLRRDGFLACIRRLRERNGLQSCQLSEILSDRTRPPPGGRSAPGLQPKLYFKLDQEQNIYFKVMYFKLYASNVDTIHDAILFRDISTMLDTAKLITLMLGRLT